ncbi:MAG: glycosyltransferase family 4 protein [Spirochaetia bacterium]|nr:glycosyltransferase family 4 protein [Spirochaetia bacterium]
MRIGIDGRIIFKRGVGRYIENLVKNLIEIDRENKYFIYLDSRSTLNDYIEAKNCMFRRLPAANALFYEQWLLPDAAKNDRVDVLHGTDNTLPYIKRSYNGKKVVTIHDTMFVRPLKTAIAKPTLKQAAVDAYNKFSIPLSGKIADHVITVSEYSKSDIVKHVGIKPEKISVIYEAAGKKYRVINNEKKLQELREKYAITKPFILLSAASDTRKNVIRAIEAFNIFNNMTEFKYRLVITSIGKKELDTTHVMDKIKELNLEKYVIITEYVGEEEMVQLYNAAFFFLFPSMWEGFGLQVLEAFACGLPVVTSNNTSLSEISGDAAQFIDPFSVEDMVHGMIEVEKSEAKRQSLKEKGFIQAGKFSWKQTAQETLKIYEKVAAAGNKQ